MEYLTVYDQSGRMLAVLDTAYGIGYTLQHNDLWTAQFTLAAGDPGNAYCAAHNLVRLPDGTRDTGLYRIVGMPSGDESGPLGGVKTYSLEHVMATLLDDVLFGYHEIGGTGVHTEEVMEYILDHQTVTRWQLGVVEFDDQFQYHFENVSLLSALLSLGEVLTEEYTWDFDTDTTPWTVNLRRADATPGCGIHYGRNLVSIKKTMDATALVTRLYPLGYGEGVNQLTIKEVNGGEAFIDADTIGTWGIKCSVYTDTRIQDAATLKARAEQVLQGYKNPYITYTAKAVDLYLLTGYPAVVKVNGTYYLIYSRILDADDGTGSQYPTGKYIGLAKSTDLIHWTQLTSIEHDGYYDMWAPEWCKNPNGSYSVWLSCRKTSESGALKLCKFDITCFDPFTYGTLTEVSTSGIGNIFDVNPHYIGNEFYFPYSAGLRVRFAKMENNVITAYSATADWNDENLEGPYLIEMDGFYRMYVADHLQVPNTISYADSTDMINWGDIVKINLPYNNLQHCSLIYDDEWINHKFNSLS